MPKTPKHRSLTNIEARDWYNAKIDQIDVIEQEMRRAGTPIDKIFEVTTNLRNEARLEARDLMKDRVLAEKLQRSQPPKTPEEVL